MDEDERKMERMEEEERRGSSRETLRRDGTEQACRRGERRVPQDTAEKGRV